jgi:hypothetical protein
MQAVAWVEMAELAALAMAVRELPEAEVMVLVQVLEAAAS